MINHLGQRRHTQRAKLFEKSSLWFDGRNEVFDHVNNCHPKLRKRVGDAFRMRDVH